jgi:GNAT superfamily N-acetyltransferase
MIHLDPSRREEAIEAGWLAYRERVPGFEQAYRSACQNWEVVAVCDDNEVAGALLAKDGVIHLGIRPEYRGKWASRRVIKEMLSYGRETTLMPDEDDDFVRRIGFVKEGGAYVVRV